MDLYMPCNAVAHKLSKLKRRLGRIIGSKISDECCEVQYQ